MPQEFSRFTRSFAALAGLLVLAGCGGGGSGSGGNPRPGGPQPPSGSSITVSGRVTFDRLPFQSTAGGGLNAAAPVVSPAREVIVEAVTGNTVTSTSTDSNGNYSISVPANSNSFIRVRAQMLKEGSAPTWNFTVRNNTNSDAVYVLQGDSFATGTTNMTRDLHAPSGWTGTSYGNTRAAAPFAILDTVYGTKQLILSANASAQFPALNLYWSMQNRTVDSPFCPDDGNIGTSFYINDPSIRDSCSSPQAVPAGIYILGAYASGNGDTDEFDSHVIAHEFGHYFEDRFSRSDSIGGQHGMGDRLDLRVAFGEGWGNAFAAMSLNDPNYRDSSGGISNDFGFSLEADSPLNEGWFSEASVGEMLWDIFDANTPAEPVDQLAEGFGPIYQSMIGAQLNTEAFTSWYSFRSGLFSLLDASKTGFLADIEIGERINGRNDFGVSELNDGGDPSSLPIYGFLTPNDPKVVCTSSVNGSTDLNKLGNRRFLLFEFSAPRLATITAVGVVGTPGSASAEDPDMLVYRRTPHELLVTADSTEAGRETIAQRQFEFGTYLLEVYDFKLSGTNQPPRCMTISLQTN